MHFKHIMLTGAATLLFACGGTTTPGFEELQDSSDAMAAKYLTADGNLLPGVTATPWADVPTNGSANFDGYVAGTTMGGKMVGELDMTVDFAGNTVSGSADNFEHDVNGSYAGELDLSGSLNRGAAPTIPQISGILSGTLSNDQIDYDTAIALDGDMIGSDYGAVGGYADGSVGANIFEGLFVAER